MAFGMRFAGDSQHLFDVFCNISFHALSRICKKRLATISLVMSVCLSAAIRPYFMKVDILIFYGKSVQKIRVSLQSDNNDGTLHEGKYTILIISYSVLFRMRNVSDKSCRGNQNARFIFNNIHFSENSAFYEIMWRNMVEPDRPQNTIWRMRIEFWIPNATNTHLQYVILIAFPLQQWLCERAPTLRCAYFASVLSIFLAATL
jgi:hypothetical protein